MKVRKSYVPLKFLHINLIQTLTKLAAISLNRLARLRRQHKAYSISYLTQVFRGCTSNQSRDIPDLLKDCQGNFGPEKLGPRDQYSTKIMAPLDRDFRGISVLLWNFSPPCKKHKLDLKIYIDCIQVQDKVYSYM